MRQLALFGGVAELAALLHTKSASLWPPLLATAALRGWADFWCSRCRAVEPACQPPWPLLLQDTLNAVFGSVKGEECIFLWRFIGGVLATLLPALAYGCRVSARIWYLGMPRMHVSVARSS